MISFWVWVILWPTASQPVYLGIKHPSGAYDQIFITVGQLRVCWCGTLSLTRGRVCRLQLLLALASAVIFGSESHTSFSSPPTTRRVTVEVLDPASTREYESFLSARPLIYSGGIHGKCLLLVRIHGNLCTELVSRNPPPWKRVLLSQQRCGFQDSTTSIFRNHAHV
jgi:hypothetical protein